MIDNFEEEHIEKSIDEFRLRTLQKQIYKNAVDKGFWDKDRNNAEMLMLIVSELGEALEGMRIGDWDNVKEEMADVVIRVMDFCEGRNIDLEHEIVKKMKKNKLRPKLHGKKF